jgi:hypothetical protein
MPDVTIPSTSPPPFPTSQRVSTGRNPFGPILRLFRFWRANNSATVTNMSHLIPPPFNHSHSGLTPPPRNEGIRELSRRVGQLVETCTYRGHLASDELCRKRTRACVKAITELVFRGNADLCWFGNTDRALRWIGAAERIHELSPERLDQSFVSHWTCLSIMAIRQALCNSSVQHSARNALISFANFLWPEAAVNNETLDDRALQAAVIIDQNFKQVWECSRALCLSLFDGLELTTSQAVNKLNNRDWEISELERINEGAHAMTPLDMYIAEAWRKTTPQKGKLINYLVSNSILPFENTNPLLFAKLSTSSQPPSNCYQYSRGGNFKVYVPLAPDCAI